VPQRCCLADSAGTLPSFAHSSDAPALLPGRDPPAAGRSYVAGGVGGTAPAREIKKVIAAAAPHHHPELEAPAAREFAALWVSDAHWEAADAATRK
jgi:hypothetical protein